MRLIDADAITRSTELVGKLVVHDFTPYIKAEDLLQFIDKLPTAYNVDKVVEQLADEILCDGCSECTNCFELNKRSECNSYKAIEKIVKAGGIDEF